MVEFKDEEFVMKAIETMNKHDLSGRPLNIKEVRADSAKQKTLIILLSLKTTCFGHKK